MTDLQRAVAPLIDRLDALFDRIEAVLPPPLPSTDWSASAFRWRTRGGRGWLEAVKQPHRIRFEDLQGVDDQKQRIAQNTKQFVAGRSANNVLLTGARGTGKSSLVKAVLNRFATKGLRLIEVDKDELVHLPEIVDLIAARKERFIIFCDDLSFESGEPGYKAMKSILDGSITGMPDNLLVYATSNRRHLMPEKMSENLETKYNADGDIHPGETTEEKVSLSERFGLWLSFYPFGQDHYLEICGHWLAEFGMAPEQIEAARGEALQWSLMRGSRSGRVAWQFARDHAGRHVKEAGHARHQVKLTEVAAAVIERRAADGAMEFLLGQRAPGTFYPGFWEFPGGKVEAGETAHAALVRELGEELGIGVTRADPWLCREHVYEHAHVRLNFFRVRDWCGELHDHVHSALAWQQRADTLTVSPMLPANAPVLAALALPDFYAISHAGEIGIDAQLMALAHALEGGLRLVQLREPKLDGARRAAFVHAAVDLCHQYGARVLVNGDTGLAEAAGADGVHLPAQDLAALERRPDFPLVAASCHAAAELDRAATLGCDFAVVGPVRPTASHPGAPGIGWDAFAAALAVPPLPTFALGGLSRADLDAAQRAGAHGIAAIRAAWV